MEDDKVFLSTSPWVKSLLFEPESISADDRSFIDSIGVKKCYAKGTLIITMGSRGEKMYFLHKGMIRYYMLSVEGTEKPVIYAAAGCFVGEEAYFHNQPTIYNAMAMENVEVTEISSKYREEILSRTGLSQLLIRSLSIKARILAHQIEDLAFRNTTEKLSRLLYCLWLESRDDNDKNKAIKATITQQELASIAGAHRVSITNAISKLKKDGIISTGRDGAIVVEKPDKLREYGFWV
ncbi:Crp/Fnr family transcriptional regulator [Desulfofalx alkaliphila]|uniref:Crp/Fnr family transcriptional regulator n=1 Tax=Desulfofalx alkaliphila TaxID=105483 RepID=UPI0004E12CCD|nr:Crp/Fnr family transcriptional regulator [Desulfofalx alkaliphila]